MTDPSVETILADDQALLAGHFILRSGMHSPRYLQCAKVLQHPEHAELLCRLLSEKVGAGDVSAVIAPATGGIVVGYELARALDARAIFAERVDDVFRLRRGFEILPGEKVVVAEDVITTGGAAKEVVELVRGLGGEVTAVASIINRSGTNPFDVPFHFTCELDVPAWDALKCPLCAEGSIPEKPGSRKEVAR